jgi:hypothetical protein
VDKEALMLPKEILHPLEESFQHLAGIV